jgi:hypothetical protein
VVADNERVGLGLVVVVVVVILSRQADNEEEELEEDDNVAEPLSLVSSKACNGVG